MSLFTLVFSAFCEVVQVRIVNFLTIYPQKKQGPWDANKDIIKNESKNRWNTCAEDQKRAIYHTMFKKRAIFFLMKKNIPLYICRVFKKLKKF